MSDVRHPTAGLGPASRVPRTLAELEFLLAQRPDMWEVLYFGAVLLEGWTMLADKRRSHLALGAVDAGIVVDQSTVATYAQATVNQFLVVMHSSELLLASEASEAAFGAPGQAGDAERIRMLAGRLNAMCETLMDISAQVRGVMRPPEYDTLFEALARLADKPMQGYGAFVERTVADLDRVPEALAAGRDPSVSLGLFLDTDNQALDAFNREIDRVLGSLEE